MKTMYFVNEDGMYSNITPIQVGDEEYEKLQYKADYYDDMDSAKEALKNYLEYIQKGIRSVLEFYQLID